ncbi:MAG: hypothetical protein AAB966_00245 [Patescibacteria group bacterium]
MGAGPSVSGAAANYPGAALVGGIAAGAAIEDKCGKVAQGPAAWFHSRQCIYNEVNDKVSTVIQNTIDTKFGAETIVKTKVKQNIILQGVNCEGGINAKNSNAVTYEITQGLSANVTAALNTALETLFDDKIANAQKQLSHMFGDLGTYPKDQTSINSILRDVKTTLSNTISTQVVSNINLYNSADQTIIVSDAITGGVCNFENTNVLKIATNNALDSALEAVSKNEVINKLNTDIKNAQSQESLGLFGDIGKWIAIAVGVVAAIGLIAVIIKASMAKKKGGDLKDDALKAAKELKPVHSK